MKLSFSTLTCPDWRFSEIISTAADLGYAGVEIRGVADQMYAPHISAFSDARIAQTCETLKRTGIEIPILTSSAYLIDNPDIAAAEQEVHDYVLLAERLGVPYVRVLMERTPDPTAQSPDLDAAAAKFGELCDWAAPHGVTLLTETNGLLGETAVARNFLAGVNRPNMGIIWDVHHPYRFYGETPAKSVLHLGSYIKHVHLKDSVKGTNGKITYMLTGYGDLPFGDIINCLKDIGYDGYLSYEWVKRWSPELAEPGISLFSYISCLRGML